jgi:hypothetical protein
MIDNASVASDLEALLSGALSEESFRRQYPSRLGSPLLEAIWDGLEHYLADVDIRARDSTYRDFQEVELRKLILLLRQRAPFSELRRITFLSSS